PRGRAAGRPPELALLHPDHPVPDPGAGVRGPEGRTDFGDPVRWPAQDHRSAGGPVPGLGTRRLHGSHTVLRDHRCRGRGGRRGAARPDGDAAVHRLPRRGLLPALDRERQGKRAGRRRPGTAAEGLRGELGPTPEALDLTGLDTPREDIEAALRVDPEEWRAEIPQITEWFGRFGDKLPGVLWAELDALRARLGLE